MSLPRTLGIVLVAGLLTVTLASTNVVVAGHQTVLDPGFVIDTLEEEDAYAEFDNATQQALAERADVDTNGSLAAGVVEEAVTEAYIKRQVDRNIRNGYAYLHGNEPTLNLTVRTRPVVENASAAVERRISNASVQRLLNQTGAEIGFDRGPINRSMFTRMDEGPEEYRAVRSELRDNLREPALDRAVNESYQRVLENETLTDGMLIELRRNEDTENPHDEKQRVIRNNSDAVNVTIREEITTNRTDEVDSRVDDGYEEVIENETRTDAMLVELGRKNDTRRPHSEKQQIIRDNSEEVNETIRDRVVSRMVNESYETVLTNETRTDQALVALRLNDGTENPHGEKQRIIRDNSEAVNTTLREEIRTNRSEELDQAIDDELRSLGNETSNETIGDAETVDESVQELRAVYTRGLTTNMTYEEFESQRTTAKETLAANTADRTEQRLNESVPATITFSEISNPTLRQQFERAKGIVGLIDLAAIALPIVAAVLIGIVYALTRSIGQVLSTAGASFFFAGLPTFAITAWARGTIGSYIPDNAGFVGDLMTTLFGRVLGTLAGQSLAIAVVGVVLWAVGFAIRKEYVDIDALTG
jgi:hypothetical protein